MENCSFHSQLLSAMEVLAKAAEGEINRRVDISCAVLRLEVRQSRRDIDLLKKKCEVMEAELRRTRIRARRNATGRFYPLVKVVLDKERESTTWDRQMDPEGQNSLQQCGDTANVPIKEECAEEDAWKSNSEDELSEQLPCFEASQTPQTGSFVEHHQPEENPADPGSVFSPTDPYVIFPEQQLNTIQNEALLSVKRESDEEPDKNAAPLDSASQFGREEGDGQLWSSLCRDAVGPSFSYAEQQCESMPSVHTSHSGLVLEDTAPQIHSVGESYSVSVSAVRVKRRARLLGCKRPQPDEGENALSQIITTDQCLTPQQAQHQNISSSPSPRNCGEALTPLGAAADAFYRHGRSRFSCTDCDKSFRRFCQLKEHLRSHTGEKPYSCVLCGRSFTKQCNLIRHAVVHSGEKPYECSLCGKCFTQRSSLKSHQKTAH